MAKKLSARQKFIQKINARLRKQYKAGVSEDLVSSEILDKISDVGVTDKGYITIKEEDFNEALAKTIDMRVKTLSEVKKTMKDDSYNLNKIAPTEKELVMAYNSRLFMEGFMGNYFREYYAAVSDKTSTQIKENDNLRTLDSNMHRLGQLLQSGEDAKARELIENKIKPALKAIGGR